MGEGSAESLAGLTDAQRATAWQRWHVIRPAVEDGVPLTAAAKSAGVAARTAQRWMAAYRAGGLVALARPRRADAGSRRTHPQLVALIEGLALQRPAPTVAHVCRQVAVFAVDRGLPAPSYTTAFDVLAAIDPGLAALAHKERQRTATVTS